MRRKLKKFETKVEEFSKTEKMLFYTVVFSIFLSVGMMVGFLVARNKRQLLAKKEVQIRIETEKRVEKKLENFDSENND